MLDGAEESWPGCLSALTAVFVAAWLMVAPAMAQEAGHAFTIPAKPVAAALIDLAVQGHVSISTAAGARCRGVTRALKGAYSVPEALRRLLDGSACRAEMIDPTTFRVVPVSIPAPHPAQPRRPTPPARPRPSAPTAGEVGEVVVTATRRPTRLDRAPYAIGVMTAEELRDSRVTDTAQLASQMAGVTVTNLGAGRDKILIRGLSDGPLTGRTQSTVGIYLDNVRVTYNAPDPDLRLTDIERVEVLRGPQGSLYGGGSIGGVLHIVTRQPELDRFSGTVSLTGSTTRDGAPGAVVEGVVNVPVGERLAIRLVGYSERDGGYFDNAATSQADVNRTVRSGGRVALRVQLAPDWTATLGYVRQTINSRDAQYGDARLGPFERSNIVAEPHDNDFTEVGLTVDGVGRLGRLTASSAFIHHEIASVYDASPVLPLFAPLPPAASAFDQDDTITMLVNEVTLTSHPSDRLQWLAGAFYSRGRQDSVSTLQTGVTDTVYREGRSDRIDEAAVYGEISYTPLARLQLTVGGRAFRSTVSTASSVAQPLKGAVADFNGRMIDTGFAPKAVASWRVGRDRLLYVQASEGYRSGGFNTSGLVGQAFGEPGNGVEPYRRYSGDELWNYEAGAKFALLQSRLRLRVAAFYSVWTDIQTDQLLASGLPFTANIGDGHVIGFEAEGAFRQGGLTVRANLLLDNPELVRPNPAFPSRADTGLPGVPALSYGGGIGYRWELTPSIDGLVDADVAYVGPSTLTFDSATAPRMGGYATVRVSAGVQTDHWRVVGFINNLTDDRGDTFAYGNPFTLRLFGQVTPQRPRTIGVTVSRSY